MCRNKNRKGGGGVKIVILSWDKPKKYGISKKHSKQAIGQVKKNYKMFANPVFITPGRYYNEFYTSAIQMPYHHISLQLHVVNLCGYFVFNIIALQFFSVKNEDF